MTHIPRDVPYFKPHEPGPLFDDAEDTAALIDDADTFLACNDRDIEAAVARRNSLELAEVSFRLWAEEQIRDIQDK